MLFAMLKGDEKARVGHITVTSNNSDISDKVWLCWFQGCLLRLKGSS